MTRISHSRVSRRGVLSALVSAGVLFATLAISSTQVSATITDGLTPGLPTIPMPYQTGPGVWNEVENATGIVTAGVVGNGVFQPGTFIDGKAASRPGYTMIWNPIGAASWGQYYTNGLYVAQGGQYVLPGTTEVRAPDGTVISPAPISSTPTPPSSGGVSGVDVLVINSNGARCQLTSSGWWYGSSSCIGSDIQFTVCFVSSDSQITFDRASWGFALKNSNGTVLYSDSYPPAGVTAGNGPSCASGNGQSWHYQQLTPGSSYVIEAWGSNGGQSFTKRFAFSSPSSTGFSPPSDGGSTSPTSSATTPTTSASTPSPSGDSSGSGSGSSSSSGGGSSSTSSLARCVSNVCGYAVVSPTGRVHGVVVCSDWCTGQITSQEYMGCPAGCRLIVQAQQTADGNVAGWHGPEVVFDDATQRFSLPGGGWIQSGARMEDAYFPPSSSSPSPGGGTTPTSSATTPIDGGGDATTSASPDLDDENTVNGATAVVAYMASSGVMHQSLADFIWFETTTLVSPIWIGLELPAIDSNAVSYRTFFDPVGSRPLALVGQGSFGDSNVSIMSNGARRTGPSLVLVDRKALRGSRGMLIVEVSVGGRVVGYAASSIGAVKTYSSCAKLRADYPGGVSFGPGVTNVVSVGELLGPNRRPVADQSLYTRNARLDTDRDRIACEP